uniref:Uncharacterized protein n=1 Tax=Terrapene triunguis TaxID=2587831 RepID=A0A674J6H8_9SAUR
SRICGVWVSLFPISRSMWQGIAHCSPELLSSSNPPALASPAAGITGTSHSRGSLELGQCPHLHKL